MSSALINAISWLAGTPCCRASRGKRCETFATAGPQSWVVISTNVTGADISVKVFNSCRNRHCPKCQATARARWLAEREAELLPVPYFHVVFTLPQQIARLALQNPRQIYTILFQAASETLLTIAADPRHLGASIGFLAVLHTWGQNLHLHPHLHCIVPGGGFSPDGSRWITCQKDSFFLPYKVLSRLFRKLFLLYLGKAFRKGQLRLSGELRDLAKPAAFQSLCEAAATLEWVVHLKPPFGGPRRVLKYLARYTLREGARLVHAQFMIPTHLTGL